MFPAPTLSNASTWLQTVVKDSPSYTPDLQAKIALGVLDALGSQHTYTWEAYLAAWLDRTEAQVKVAYGPPLELPEFKDWAERLEVPVVTFYAADASWWLYKRTCLMLRAQRAAKDPGVRGI